jgi:hypothetical protein
MKATLTPTHKPQTSEQLLPSQLELLDLPGRALKRAYAYAQLQGGCQQLSTSKLVAGSTATAEMQQRKCKRDACSKPCIAATPMPSTLCVICHSQTTQNRSCQLLQLQAWQLN